MASSSGAPTSFSTDARWFARYDAANHSPAELQDLVRAGVSKFAALLLSNVDLPPEPFRFLDEVGSVLGRRIAYATPGKGIGQYPQWLDVRFDPDGPYTFQYSKTAQPLHNDGAYLEPAPDLALFYLEKQAEDGGESLFVDAQTIADRLAFEEPDLYRAANTVPVRFNAPPMFGRTTTILDSTSGELEIVWNYYRVSPGQGSIVDDLRERFRVFLDRMVETGQVFTFRLDAGDVLIFNERKLLHGRRAFSAVRTGDRLLWKTYFIRERG